MERSRRAAGPPPGDHIRTENAPPPGVPLAFFLVATAGLACALAVGALHPADFLRHWVHNRTVLAVLHLFVLGWGTTLAMGAAYQLAPVVLHGTLHGRRLAFTQLAVHVAGVSLLVSGFWWVRPRWVAAGGAVVLASVLLFATELALTLRTARYRHRVGTGLVLATGYLVLTATWGLTLALSLRYGWALPIGRVVATHLALGAGGWFTVLIAFVSLKLTPLFAPGPPPPPRPAATVLAVLTTVPGALVAVLSLVPPLQARLFIVLLTVLGAAAAVGYARLLWGVGPRRRGRREPPVRFAVAGASLFAATAVLGAAGYALDFPDLTRRGVGATAFVYLLLTGWVGTMTIGQLYRILPFVIWLDRFRRRSPGEQLPFLHEIADRRLGDVLLALWLVATGLGSVGLWTSRAPVLGAGMAAGFGASLLLAYAEARAFTVWQSGVRWPLLPPYPAAGALKRTDAAGARHAGDPAGPRPAR